MLLIDRVGRTPWPPPACSLRRRIVANLTKLQAYPARASNCGFRLSCQREQHRFWGADALGRSLSRSYSLLVFAGM